MHFCKGLRWNRRLETGSSSAVHHIDLADRRRIHPEMSFVRDVLKQSSSSSSTHHHELTVQPLDASDLAWADKRWPGNPFHEGEMAFQERAGSQQFVMSYAPQFLRPSLTGSMKEFYTEVPFVAAAARDASGMMWCTLLENTRENVPFLEATADDILQIDRAALPVQGDALEFAFTEGEVDLGLLGLKFETASRNRVNGRVITNSKDPSHLEMVVDLAFGNCPQYIKPRHNWTWVQPAPPTTDTCTNITRSDHLSTEQIQWIETAETFFTATGYRGKGFDNRFGNDAAHRGGPPGFVVVQQSQLQEQTILWTEYPGNNHFNSFGNLIMDSRIGLCFPNFANGGLLQVSGTAIIEMGELQKGGRRVVVTVRAVNELPPGALPIRWEQSHKDTGTRMVRVVKMVQETPLVKSFYLEDSNSDPESRHLPNFQAGQHLPLELPNPAGNGAGTLLSRRYSLSDDPHGKGYYRVGHYRISVKRESNGQASSFLHDTVQVGDEFRVGMPAGEFLLAHNSKGPTVLISAGIGVTPILSMLHDLASPSSPKNDNNTVGSHEVIWIHGARNGRLHAMRQEVEAVADAVKANEQSAITFTQRHIFYSQPNPEDTTHDFVGRVTAPTVHALLAPEVWDKATFYMCGPTSFMADLQTGLEDLGTPPNKIFSESF